jgi:hypothetical protein
MHSSALFSAFSLKSKTKVKKQNPSTPFNPQANSTDIFVNYNKALPKTITVTAHKYEKYV